MRIAFLVNDCQTEKAAFATTCLALAAIKRGHQVFYLDVNGFVYDRDDQVHARGFKLKKSIDSNEGLLEAIQDEKVRLSRFEISNLDVLFLRNNPADDAKTRPWAAHVGVIFGQIAARAGVLVVNDPHHLAGALNKLYFQFFPEEVRPEALISRKEDEIRAFIKDHKGNVVLKPLQGSGGQGVFLVSADGANLNQIFDAISRDGYVVAQEYLPEAAEGDLRVFLMNGEILECKGKAASLRRISKDDDIRSNITAGGKTKKGKVDDQIREIAALVKPKLIRDGMFLVGLDIAGGKLLEVNVFSPGGLFSIERFEKVPFSEMVIESLEKKLEIKRRYPGDFTNTELATM